MTSDPRMAAVYAALAAVVAAGPADAVPIEYTPDEVGLDNHRYSMDSVNTLRRYSVDEQIQNAAHAGLPHVEIAVLAQSPHWKDRVRAAAVRASLYEEITLPDGFPCIYEPANSPRMARVLSPRPQAWVVSPDEGMLRELLPLYRELWGAYESQWPTSPNRHFEVGHLDGLSPNGVYRPGTTAADVIGATMITHDGIYARAPEHLRAMHPLHTQWEASKAARQAKFYPHHA